MQNDITRHWIERFEEAERQLLEQPELSDFDRIMVQAYRSQIISLKMELEKETRDESYFQEET